MAGKSKNGGNMCHKQAEKTSTLIELSGLLPLMCSGLMMGRGNSKDIFR